MTLNLFTNKSLSSCKTNETRYWQDSAKNDSSDTSKRLSCGKNEVLGCRMGAEQALLVSPRGKDGGNEDE
jgi:hypothetical protein